MKNQPTIYRSILLLIVLLLSTRLHAQNLVPNPSFEQYINCPYGTGLLTSHCSSWRSYTNDAASYFNGCQSSAAGVPINDWGYQHAAHGNGYAGIRIYQSSTIGNTNARQYIAAPIGAMIPGGIYEVSISVSLGNHSSWGTNDLSVFFYDNGPNSVSTVVVLPIIPQVSYSNYGVILDTGNWVRLSKFYIPDSAYDNMVIGSFRDDNSITKAPAWGIQGRAYYYIDSVVVRLKTHLNINFNDTVLCQGDTIVVPYTAAPNNYFNINNTFTLQLSGPTGSFASPTNIGSVNATGSGTITAVVIAVTPGTGYRLRLVASNPADTSLPTEKNITLNVTPSVTASSNTPLCTGAPTLNLSATSTPSNVSYSWAGPSFSSSTQNPTINNPGLGNSGNYIVSATLGQCTGKDTVTVAIHQTPTVTAGSNSPVCSGGNINLTANGSPSSVIYNWEGPALFSSTQQNPVVGNAGTPNAGDYTVIVNNNGCMDTATVNVTVLFQPATVNVYPVPNDSICTSSAATFVAVVGNGGSNPQYQWYKNGTAIPGATAVSYASSAINTGDKIHCVVMPGTPCGTATNSDTTTMTVLPYLPASVSITADPGTLLSPWQTVKFTAVPVNGGSNPVYQWKRNGQDVVGATGNTWSAYNLSNNDTVHVVLMSSYLCPQPAAAVSNRLIINLKMGIEDVKGLNNIDIYPNPAKNTITIVLPQTLTLDGIQLHDIQGRMIRQFDDDNHTLDISGIASGLYFLHIQTNKGKTIQRFIKE